MKSLRPIVPPGPLYAEDENAKAEELVRQGKFAVQGADFESASAGPMLVLPPRREGFYAKITSGSNPYAWTEQEIAAGGTWIDKPSGRTGTVTVDQAYERGGDKLVPINAIVFLEAGEATVAGVTVNQEFTFFWRPKRIYAKITGGTNPYAWTQQTQTSPGVFVNLAGGLNGTTVTDPAWDIPGNPAITLGTIVELVLSPAANYWIISEDVTDVAGLTGTRTAVSAASCSAGTLSVTTQTVTLNNGNVITWA